MKKIIALLVILTSFTLAIQAKPKLTKKVKSKNFAKAKSNTKCRVCCTIRIYNSDGESAQSTVCAGWLLTSCETAAERACTKAMENVVGSDN